MYQKSLALFITFILSLVGCAERNPYNEHERQTIKQTQNCLHTAKFVAKYGNVIRGNNPIQKCLESVQHFKNPPALDDIQKISTDAVIFTETSINTALYPLAILLFLMLVLLMYTVEGGPGSVSGKVTVFFTLVIAFCVWGGIAGLVALTSYLYALNAS